jgi:organic hydroperoxide reductase OsmC/OhrA
MRFPCIFVIPNYCQFTIQGPGSSALIWINVGLDCETDRAHDVGLKRCNLPKVAGRSGVRPRQIDISNCCPLLLLTKVIELGLANGSYSPFSVAPVVRLRVRYGKSCSRAGYVVGQTLHDPKQTNRTAAAVRSAAVATSLRVPYKKKMSEHKVTLKWERGGAEFSYQKYPRDHIWSFDGGHTMAATAAPAYLGNPAHVDPEEAFVASLSSCHMLTFLAIACKQRFVLDSYEDEAVGHLGKNADGKLAITRVELRPKITWSGDRKPSAEELDKMHHAAHENCFIANSVKTEVKVTKI